MVEESKDKELSEMDEGDIDSLLLHMVAEGQVELSAKNGDSAYKLTEQGAREAEDLLGGLDVAEVASAFTKLLVKYGDAIGHEVEDTVKTWLMMVRIARLWKQYSVLPWDAFVKKLEDEVLEPCGYFKKYGKRYST